MRDDAPNFSHFRRFKFINTIQGHGETQMENRGVSLLIVMPVSFAYHFIALFVLLRKTFYRIITLSACYWM